MKKDLINIGALMTLAVLSGCQMVHGALKGGFVWVVVLILIVIFAIMYILSRGKK